jgi:hypothetical protein
MPIILPLPRPDTGPPPLSGADLVALRHPEWREHEREWRWLLDSYEGGARYRDAEYGQDARGMPVRNLVRHKREYPDPRTGPVAGGGAGGIGPFGYPVDPDAPESMKDRGDGYAHATDDDYELRRARTPVPTFVAEAIDGHLAKVFAREVDRPELPAGLADLAAWRLDVDGRGTPLDAWMAETVAPLLLLYGQLDILCDHPKAPTGAAVATRADAARLGLGRCVASYILPENLVWWRLDAAGLQYEECLVREHGGSGLRFRHWRRDGSTLFDGKGRRLAELPHPYGRVPIVRLFDRRKPRCMHVGRTRYGAIAERQREYYNRDSELILSDTTQAHPLLQGPEDYVQADGTIPIGPGWLLPKKKNTAGGAATYEGFEVVDFPKGAAESIRANMAAIRDDVDRDARLTKPAGAAGTGRSTVAQSGLSKAFDAADANALLAQLAAMLARNEAEIARLVLVVLRDSAAAAALADGVEVTYPRTFDLLGPEELAAGIAAFQDALGNAGAAAETESAMLAKLARAILPGESDEFYRLMEAEVGEAVRARADERTAAAELAATLPPIPAADQAPIDQTTPEDAGAGPAAGPPSEPDNAEAP